MNNIPYIYTQILENEQNNLTVVIKDIFKSLEKTRLDGPIIRVVFIPNLLNARAIS